MKQKTKPLDHGFKRIHFLTLWIGAILISDNLAFTQTTFNVTLPPDSITQTSALLQGFYVSDDTSFEANFEIGRTEEYGLTEHLNKNDGGHYTTYTMERRGDTVFVFCFLERLIPNSQWHYRLRIDIHDIYYEYSNDQSFTTLTDTSVGGFMIPIYFEGMTFRGFGVHTHATNCIDYTLGEAEVPPLPPFGTPDLRFVPPISKPEDCYGQGLYVDIRPYESAQQSDTFKIKFQAGEFGGPVVIAWGNPGVQYTGNVRLVYPLDGSLVATDMKVHSADTIPEDIGNLYIIAEGPTNLLSAWFTDLGTSSITLKGMYNPNGVSTEAWFEWGTTNEYENATPHQSIGTSTTPVTFDAHISGLLPDALYYYRVVTWSNSGTSYGIDQSFSTNLLTNIHEDPPIPNKVSLSQNYPNPFNPSTVIRYRLPARVTVSLKVFNVLGQQVASLVDEIQEAGEKSIEWNAVGMPSGVYFYKLQTQESVQARKLVVLK